MSQGKINVLKKVLYRWGPILLSVVVIAVMIVLLMHSDLLDELDLSNPHWDYLALLLLTRAVYFAFIGMMLALFVAQGGVHLSFVEWYGLSIVGVLTNMVTPVSGGAFVRGGYLKMRHAYPVSHYSALLAALVIVNYFVSGLMGLMILVGLSVRTRQPVSWEAITLMVGVIVVAILAVTLPLERLPLPREGRIMGWVHYVMEGWQQIRTSPSLLAKQVVLVVLSQLVQAVSYSIGLLGIGQKAPYLHMLFVSVVTNIVRVTPIRNVFGLREFFAALGAQMVGTGMAQGAATALLLRLSNWALVLLLGPLFVFLLSRRLGKPLLSSLKSLDAQESR
jgi:hypothetical protein